MTMEPHRQPLVSVVTPVYNGEPYLADCIESIVAQTYSNWEYCIVNNCSTDRTLEIAERYAKLDPRIRVHSNEQFLDIIGNANNGFRLISPDSKYCKSVSADDWLYPECLQRMVELAEAHPSVGIVGAYQVAGGGDNWYLRTDGLSYYTTVLTGRDICRKHFLSGISVFGNPTSNLYRSDLVRSTDTFFPNLSAEADVSACFKHLKDADFGFVHQVLSYERVHSEQITTTSRALNAYLGSRLNDLTAYGSFYLTPHELKTCIEDLLAEYYRFLAISAVNFQSGKFWHYHKKRLQDLGYPLSGIRLAGMICAKFADLLLNPKQTVEKMVRRTNFRPTGSRPGNRPGLQETNNAA
jgi:glycosyltransferase involved in cell wall biosynthesis